MTRGDKMALTSYILLGFAAVFSAGLEWHDAALVCLLTGYALLWRSGRETGEHAISNDIL